MRRRRTRFREAVSPQLQASLETPGSRWGRRHLGVSIPMWAQHKLPGVSSSENGVTPSPCCSVPPGPHRVPSPHGDLPPTRPHGVPSPCALSHGTSRGPLPPTCCASRGLTGRLFDVSNPACLFLLSWVMFWVLYLILHYQIRSQIGFHSIFFWKFYSFAFYVEFYDMF